MERPVSYGARKATLGVTSVSPVRTPVSPLIATICPERASSSVSVWSALICMILTVVPLKQTYRNTFSTLCVRVLSTVALVRSAPA